VFCFVLFLFYSCACARVLGLVFFAFICLCSIGSALKSICLVSVFASCPQIRHQVARLCAFWFSAPPGFGLTRCLELFRRLIFLPPEIRSKFVPVPPLSVFTCCRTDWSWLSSPYVPRFGLSARGLLFFYRSGAQSSLLSLSSASAKCCSSKIIFQFGEDCCRWLPRLCFRAAGLKCLSFSSLNCTLTVISQTRPQVVRWNIREGLSYFVIQSWSP
jgi:hypothetical protein